MIVNILKCFPLKDMISDCFEIYLVSEYAAINPTITNSYTYFNVKILNMTMNRNQARYLVTTIYQQQSNPPNTLR